MSTAPSTTPETKKDQGFTLIELLVVVVIIGILAAVAIPVFLSQREKAADAGTKSDLKNAATLMETYYVDEQNYGAPGGVGAAAAQLSELQVTDGVTITVTDTVAFDSSTTPATQASYCLDGVHENSDEEFSYDSAAGGLQDGPC